MNSAYCPHQLYILIFIRQLCYAKKLSLILKNYPKIQENIIVTFSENVHEDLGNFICNF